MKFNGLLVLVRTKQNDATQNNLSLYTDVELRTEWDEGHHTTRERHTHTHEHTKWGDKRIKPWVEGTKVFFHPRYVPSIKHHPSDETVHLSPGFLPRQFTVVNNSVDVYSSRGVGTRVERIYPFWIYLWVRGVFFFANLFTHWERVHNFLFIFLPIE